MDPGVDPSSVLPRYSSRRQSFCHRIESRATESGTDDMTGGGGSATDTTVGNDDFGDDTIIREDTAGEQRAGYQISSEPDTTKWITTENRPREKDEQSCTFCTTFRKESWENDAIKTHRCRHHTRSAARTS